MRWEDSHFKKEEFGCPCAVCKKTYPEKFELNLLEVVDRLERIRRLAGTGIQVTSGFRCEDHNKEIGGAPLSLHLKGQAGDIKMLGYKGETMRGFFEAAIRLKVIKDGGMGTYNKFPDLLHYDTGPIRRWRD